MGTHKKQLTKPTEWFILYLSRIETGHVLQAVCLWCIVEKAATKKKWAFGAQDSDVQQGGNDGIHHVKETDA